MTKQLLKLGFAVMTTLLVLIVLWQFRIVVVYVLISLTLAAALRPLVIRLVGRGVLVRITWIILYLVSLSGFLVLLYWTGKTAVNEIQQLAYSLSEQDEWMLPLWLEGSSFEQVVVTQLPPPSLLFEAFTGDQGQLVLPTLLGLGQDIGGVLSAVFIILFLSIYWSISQVHFERLWLSLLQSEQRTRARAIWRAIEPDIGIYIHGEVMQSFFAGLLFGLGFWLLGSPYPALLALFGALACLVPMVGSAMVILFVLIVGLLTSLQLSLFTVIYALIVLIALGVWIKPRLFPRKWDNPILTIILLIAMASAFGLVGVIIAPPASVVCQILWNHLVSRRAVSGAAAQISDLKERQEILWNTIKAMDEPPPALVTSSMEHLAQLIEKAEPILQASLPVTGLPINPSKPSPLSQPVTIRGESSPPKKS